LKADGVACAEVTDRHFYRLGIGILKK
jgi:hypothetical protein